MRPFLMFCIVALWIITPAQAGDEYRLREPSAEEYLSAMPGIFDVGNADIVRPPYSNYPLLITLMNELIWRYPDLAQGKAELLYDTLVYFQTAVSGWWQEREFLGQSITLVLVNQAGREFKAGDVLKVRDFEVIVTPRDYDGDGQDELLLDIRGSSYFNQFVVMKKTGEDYALVASPLPWFGCCFHYSQTTSGFMEEQYFGDMTGDGLPEWVLALGGIGANNQSGGRLYVLQWQHGELVGIAPKYDSITDEREMFYQAPAGGGSPLFPWGVSVEFRDADQNSTVEILILQDYDDSWGCKFRGTRTFAWNGRSFELTSHDREFEDSASCALRKARDLTWEGDYARAIPFYEHSLALFTGGEASEEFTPAGWLGYQLYTTVHLALAYALTGRTEDAAALLAGLDVPTDAVEPIPALVAAAKQSFLKDQRVVDLCAAMYKTFSQYHIEAAYSAYPYWGYTVDFPEDYTLPGSGNAPRPDAARAGCAISALVSDMIEGETFTTDRSPIEQLEGLDITTDQYRRFDLDGNGSDEWLVWFASPDVDPVLFVADGATYRVSRPEIAYPAPDTTFQVFDLPGAAGRGLAQIYFNMDTEFLQRLQETGTYWYPITGCIDREGSPVFLQVSLGFVGLWRLEDHSYHLIQREWLCEPLAFDEIFLGEAPSTVIQAWQEYEGYNSIYYWYHLYLPMAFRWNADEGRYVSGVYRPKEPTPTPEPLADPPLTNALDLLRGGQYEQIIQEAEAVLAQPPTDDPLSDEMVQAARYYRALALEGLNRDDEALAAYVALFEAGPDSAWGMLAALHLQPQ